MDKAKGTVKDAVGKAVGSDKMQAEGKMDKAAGAVQKKVGDVKEAAKSSTKTATKKA